jgi:predicted acetyltransferase
MEIRKIKPEENIRQAMIVNTAFLLKDADGFEERLKNPLEHTEGYEKVWGGFDTAGKLCAVTTVNDYRTRFNGHTVEMGGVGAVGTLPESRKGGYVRKIFEKILPAMLEDGKIFSYLHPFSYPFYRKFGYELCYQPNRATIPMKYFREYPFPDGMEQYFPGSDISDISAVYHEFVKNKNLPLVRDEAHFRRRMDKDPYMTDFYTYLHRDKDGKADAYIFFFSDGGIEDRELRVKDFAWTTPEAFCAMLGFIGGLGAFMTFKWDAPPSVNLASIFTEAFDFTIENPPWGMNRILNLPRALELLVPPEKNGRVTVSVTDAHLPSNSGAYSIEWESGAVSVKRASDFANLETDIQTLTQLVTGFLSIDQVRLKRTAVINGQDDALRAVFAPKELYLADYF